MAFFESNFQHLCPVLIKSRGQIGTNTLTSCCNFRFLAVHYSACQDGGEKGPLYYWLGAHLSDF
jgi:hypothetical protein